MKLIFLMIFLMVSWKREKANNLRQEKKDVITEE